MRDLISWRWRWLMRMKKRQSDIFAVNEVCWRNTRSMVGRRTINIERRINRRLPIEYSSFLISVRILNRPNHHRFESPNKTFCTPVGLRIIWRREAMTNLKDLSETLDNFVRKMRTV